MEFIDVTQLMPSLGLSASFAPLLFLLRLPGVLSAIGPVVAPRRNLAGAQVVFFLPVHAL